MNLRKCQESKPARVATGKKQLALKVVAIAAFHAALQGLTIHLVATLPAWGQSGKSEATVEATQPAKQSPPPAATEKTLFDRIWFFGAPSGMARHPVRLDGRELFSVVRIEKQAIDGIEKQLQEFANSDFNPAALQVYSAILNGEAVIYISFGQKNDARYLMTVTSGDAEYYSADRETLAKKWSQEIEAALIEARKERQPEFIRQQAVTALAIAASTILGSLMLGRRQRFLKERHQQICAQKNQRIEENVPARESESADSPQKTPIESEAIAELQQKMTLQQKDNLYDLQRRLLQVGQGAIWGGGTFVNLGLFPQTRWIQPLIFSWLPLPLKLLGLGLSCYVGIRLSAVLIDRFFTALGDGSFGDVTTSQRVALRFSTFSKVFKSLSTAGLISISLLIGLSTVGIEIAPILAGAGLLGLGISLASQSLIKDTINGFLILLEDQYAVGDVIQVGDLAGLVENMNLRMTQLRNAEGRLITIPNSAISIVQNLSKDWSRVDLAIDVAYGTDVDRAIAVIKQVAAEMYGDRYWKELIFETPEVLGIDEIDHAGILIRVWIKTKPLQQWNVAREFRRRLKVKFDREEIAIGMPQQSLVFKNTLALNREIANANDGQKWQGEAN